MPPYSCICGARYLVRQTAVVREVDANDPVGGDGGFDRKVRANLLTELYMILGSLNAPDSVLDQVLAALEGQALPHDSLLPFEKSV